MSTTVLVSGFEVESNSSSGADLKAALTSDEREPRVLVDEGKPVPEDAEDKAKLAQAAADLGKKGGTAAAAKRAADAKAKPEEKAEGEEASQTDGKAKDDEKPLGKPRDDPRARMLEATRKEAEAKKALASERAERQALANEIREIRSALTKREPGESRQSQAEAERKPASTGKPAPEQYDDYEQYLDARDNWNRKEWAAENTRRQSEAEYQQRVMGQVGSFTQSLASAAKSDPEFNGKVAQEVMDLQPTMTLDPNQMPDASNWVADELVFSAENAPALMLYLSEHLDDLQRIAALSSPRAVTREVAKLAARLEAAPAGSSSKPEPSKAKPPVRPVTGSPHIAEETAYRDGMSLDEYSRGWKPAKR